MKVFFRNVDTRTHSHMNIFGSKIRFVIVAYEGVNVEDDWLLWYRKKRLQKHGKKLGALAIGHNEVNQYNHDDSPVRTFHTICESSAGCQI